MFGLVLSIIGVAFAAWGLLPAARTEMIRVKLTEERRGLRALGITLLAVVLVEPWAASMLAAYHPAAQPLSVAIGQILCIALVANAAYLVWPWDKWTSARLARFRPRIESLIMRGRSATVVDVFSEILPDVFVPRVQEDDGDALPNGEPEETSGLISQDAFVDALEEALPHKEFVRAACRHDRNFVADLSRLTSYPAMVGFAKIVRELMFGGDGLLIRELQSTTNYADSPARHHYQIADRCVILHTILDDVDVAERHSVWEPIGDGAIEAVHAKGVEPGTDPDQRLNMKKDDDARWDSPLGSSLWFFRLMITSAIKQGHRYDMWSAYLSHFIKAVDQILVLPNRPTLAEFPNPYCEWVADCFRLCDEAIGLIPKLADTNANRSEVGSDASNDNAIHGVLYSLGLCIWEIVTAERIPERVKQGRIEHVCMMYQKWCAKEYPEGFAEYAIEQMTASMPTEVGAELASRVARVVQHNAMRDAYRELHEWLSERFD